MPRWPLRSNPFWAEAPFFHALFPLIAAVICYDQGWLKTSSVWPAMALALLAGVVLLSLLRRFSGFTRSLFVFAFYAAAFSFGCWLCQANDIRNSPDWFAFNKDTTARNLVKIVAPPAAKERIWRMQVTVIKCIDSGATQKVCGDAFLNIYKSKTDSSGFYQSGDLLIVPSRWAVLTNSNNPFEVDYATMHRRRNICHQQFAAPNEIQLFQKGVQRQQGLLGTVHQYCDAQLAKYVTDSATHGLLQAMLLGDESSFDPELRQAYSETGVIHIVSISGSHVGVLFAAVVFLLSRIKGRKGAWLQFFIGLWVIWFYVLMAGAPPSAIRAAIMFSVIASGSIFAKEVQPLNTLFAAAIVLLCYHPMWLFAVGFQLSFSAVLSLILFYQPIHKQLNEWWPQTNKVGRFIGSGIAGSFAAEILTAPLVIYYFHNFPLFFLIANLLAAVLVGILALLGGMLIIVFSVVPPLAKVVAGLVTLFVKGFNWIIYLLQSWNPVSFKYLQIDGYELALLYLVITGASLAILIKRKIGLYLSLAALLLLLILLCRDQLNIVRQDRLIVYNVNRHNCVERVRGAHYAMLQTDSSKAEVFNTKLAHTGWGAWRLNPLTAQQKYFSLKGKKILLLDTPIKAGDSTSFPADVLIVSCSLKEFQPRQLKQIFHPQVIVAGGNQPRWLLQKWTDSCAVQNIRFHAVTHKGAFVIQ